MSLKRNVLASYASQLYVTLIGIVMVPVYLRFMGAEAYGLVGFFAMLQAWFQLMDLGLTPTMTRATASFAGGAGDALALRRLLRSLEIIFAGCAAAGAAALWSQAGAIATGWLKVEHLSLSEVSRSLELIALIIALRSMAGLYRAAINGFERLVWLSGLSIGMATLRFVAVVPFFVLVGSSPVQFFAYQAVVAVAELAIVMAKAYHLLPALAGRHRINWQFGAVRTVLGFSLSLAFTSSLWICVTQTDKLLLSTLLPLADYACFTLAVLVAGGVGIASGPISGALLPRLTRLWSQGDEAGLLRQYRQATQVVAVASAPVALMLGCFAEPVLWAWTGDARMAARAAPVLALYAGGNGILALGAFPYYLQFAQGKLRLHMTGTALFVLLLIPALVQATLRYGVAGAGWAWLLTNLAYATLWIAYVHGRLAPGLHWLWLRDDIAPVVVPPALLALLMQQLLHWPVQRWSIALVAAGAGLVLLAAAAAGSSFVRQLLHGRRTPACAGTGVS